MYVVTGGSDGLGKAIVDSLVGLGYEVMNVSRRANERAQYDMQSNLSTEKGVKRNNPPATHWIVVDGG